MFILGDVLGAGIYALMGVLSQEVGGALWAPIVAALLLALLTAGSYAELVTEYPRAREAAPVWPAAAACCHQWRACSSWGGSTCVASR